MMEMTKTTEQSQQSPVDIRTDQVEEGEGREIEVHYRDGDFSLYGGEHGVYLIPDEALEGYILVDGERYDLQQLHAHSPAEHLLDGEAPEMEIHFVHSGNGKLAVIGLFVKEGAENPLFADMRDLLARRPLEPTRLEEPFRITELLPEDRSNAQYEGSLTTQPYTENVYWIVLRHPITASAEQLEFFGGHFSGEAREEQPLNDRQLMGEEEN